MGNKREIDIPKKTTKAEEDHAPLYRAVGSREKIGNGPDFIRIPDELEKFLG